MCATDVSRLYLHMSHNEPCWELCQTIPFYHRLLSNQSVHQRH